MTGFDPLAAACEALRADLTVTAPGVDAAHRTVRRRRRRNRALAAGLAVVVFTVGVTSVVYASDRHANQPLHPVPTLTPAPLPSGPVPGPPATSASPSATGTSPTGTPSSATPTPTRGGPTGPPACTPSPAIAQMSGADVWLSLRADAVVCPGRKTRGWWATYLLDAQGVLHLYRTRSYYLDHDNPASPHFTPEMPPTSGGWCAGEVYVGSGDHPIPDTISGPDPFGIEKQLWWQIQLDSHLGYCYPALPTP